VNFPVELPPAILEKAIKLEVNPLEVEEHFVRGSGHGGQKINKTASCVELHHLPTGIDVRYQHHREQSKNRIGAWKLLILKIEEKMLGKQSQLQQENFKIRKQKQRRNRKSKEKMLAEKKQRGTVKASRISAWHADTEA
jgi:protein subunit release factor B